jgi:hypothetical protein
MELFLTREFRWDVPDCVFVQGFGDPALEFIGVGVSVGECLAHL